MFETSCHSKVILFTNYYSYTMYAGWNTKEGIKNLKRFGLCEDNINFFFLKKSSCLLEVNKNFENKCPGRHWKSRDYGYK